MTDLGKSPKIWKKKTLASDSWFMKEYHDVHYVFNIYKCFSKNCPKYIDEIYIPLKINVVHMRLSY